MTSHATRSRTFAVVALIALAGCGDTARTATTTTTTAATTTTTTTAAATTTTTSPASSSVVAYLVRDEKVAPVRRSAAANSPRAALDALMDGPSASDSGLTSAVPTGTKVLSLSVAAGSATADLSTAFGSGGGSLSMQERVAQVVYTLTRFPEIKTVTFQLDGTPVTALGGEGIMLDHPQGRGDWEAMTPAILVESPLPGDSVQSGVVIEGTANTFEATFLLRLTDSAGAVLYDHFVMATSGTGTRGTFSQVITFPTAATGAATLRVWEASAKDGSDINIVSFPLSL